MDDIHIGDLRAFRDGRNTITRDIKWIVGLILGSVYDDRMDEILCKTLTPLGVKYYRLHGSRNIIDETG